MMESVQSSGDNGAVVNFYGELGLDRTWSVEQLRAKLGKLQLHWKRRASLAGKHGEEARERLSVIEAALGTFVDEDAKERYDHQLRRAETVGADDAVNWVARAWTYYFNEDYDAATVAARKARGQGPGDPAAYVVSAWIELAQNEAERAAEYASEAYVLDEDGENAFEVQEVRGVTFHALQQYDREIDAMKKALAHAQSSQLSGVYLRLARTQFQTGAYKEAFLSCLAGLQEDKDQQLEDKLLKCAYSIIKANMRRGDGSCRHWFERHAISPSADRALNSYFDKLEKLLELEACHITPHKVRKENPDFPGFWLILISPLCLLSMAAISAFPNRILPYVVFLVLISATVVRFSIYYAQKRGYNEEVKMHEREQAQSEAISERISTLSRELGIYEYELD
mgnify:CR=1 FL=1|jgi:tetratricopeptide (TPR) repeat protein